MFVGNQEGIDVWYKLGTSDDASIQAYFSSVRNAAQKHRSAYFSDFIEQRKKNLNNQKTFSMYFDANDKKWHIDLFHTPTAV